MSGTNGGLRLAFIIQAVDKATAVVAKVRKAIDRIAGPASAVAARFGVLRDMMGSVTSAALRMGAVAAGALFGIARVTNRLDELGDLADNLNISTRALQELRYTAEAAGGSAQGLDAVLLHLNRTISEARNGDNEAALKLFREMGVTMQMLRTMSPDQVLAQLSEFGSKLPKTTYNTTALGQAAQALLGRGGKSMLTFLTLGREGLKAYADEAQRAGAVVNDEAVKAFGEFNNVLNRTKESLFGALAVAIRPSLPALTSLLDHITRLTARNKDLIGTKLAGWFASIERALPSVIDGTERFFRFIGRLFGGIDDVAQALGGWNNVLAILVGFISAKALVQVALLTQSVWALGAALWANPLGIVLGVVVALIAALPLLILHWDKLIEKMWQVRSATRDMFPQWMNNLLDDWTPAFAQPAPEGSWDAPDAAAPGQRQMQVGGTLQIKIDQEGRVKGVSVEKAPGSPMNLSVDYSGGPLAMPL